MRAFSIAGGQVHLPQRLEARAGLTQESAVRVVSSSPAVQTMAAVQAGDVIVGIDKEIVAIDDIARVLDGTRIDKRVAIHPARRPAGHDRRRPERLPER